MRCPECGATGYSRKTMTPEWRCRKCGHEWDESNPSQLTPITRNESVFRPPETVATASASDTRPYSPVGSSLKDEKDPWFVWVLMPAGFFVVSFVGLYVLYLIIGLFLANNPVRIDRNRLGPLLGGRLRPARHRFKNIFARQSRR